VIATLQAAVRAAERLRVLRDRYPLGCARMWDRPSALTSQRRAFCADIAEDVHYVRGGKGSGKTRGAAQVIAATVRGRRDPEVTAWAAANGYPVHRIPERLTRKTPVVWSAAAHDLSVMWLRPEIEPFLPDGTTFAYWNAKSEATADLPGGGRLIMKAAKQGRRAYQSIVSPLIGLDEEHEKEVADECRSRTARYPGGGGFVLVTATPVEALRKPAMSWLHDDFVVELKPGHAMAEIHGSHSPFLNRAKRRRLLAAMSESDRAVEERGEFIRPGGLVYWAWDRLVHVVPPRELNPGWLRLLVIDIGTAAPTAALAMAYDPILDQIHVYACHYARELTAAQHAEAIRAMYAELGEALPRIQVMDLETPDSRAIVSEYMEVGFSPTGAVKRHGFGIAVTNQRLSVVARGQDRIDRPGILIHDVPSCGIIAREADAHCWSDRAVARDGHTPTSTQGADHALDCLRYGAVHVELMRR
jgi:hypothetical protein